MVENWQNNLVVLIEKAKEVGLPECYTAVDFFADEVGEELGFEYGEAFLSVDLEGKVRGSYVPPVEANFDEESGEVKEVVVVEYVLVFYDKVNKHATFYSPYNNEHLLYDLCQKKVLDVWR